MGLYISYQTDLHKWEFASNCVGKDAVNLNDFVIALIYTIA